LHFLSITAHCIDESVIIWYDVVEVIIMQELFKTAIVEKRNILNELRSNNMTVQELRFFSIYLAKINPWDKSTRVVRFPMEDFRHIMGFSKLNLRQLKESTDSLLGKVVSVPDERGGFLSFTIFKRCRVYRDGDKWFVEIDASDDALPLMFDFKNRYFKYELWNALRLKSPNQIRMYEILKQYEGLGKRELTITELRELLGIDKTEYSGRTGWSDFRKKVLDSCQHALKATTDICYTYERGKVGKGGKWLSIIFYIKKNTDFIDQITLDEFIEQQPVPEPLAIEMDVLDEDRMLEQMSAVYGSERLTELAGACKYEFDKEQMKVIFGLIRDLPIRPDHLTNSLHYGHVFWLTDMYNKFLVAAKQAELYGEPIKNRYRYFCRMLENYEG